MHGKPQAGIAQLVERNLAKVEVASSSLVSRSTSRKPFTPLKRLVYSFKAEWQSGYAAACKAAYAGSIPTQASISRTGSVTRSPATPEWWNR